MIVEMMDGTQKLGGKMKVIIFGATGGIGRQLVTQTLALGHDVTAFARFRGGQAGLQNNVAIVAGDVTDAETVHDAIKGQNAVLCALGAPLSSKAQVRAHGTANIIAAMQKADVSRLICVSALGVGDSQDLLPWSYKYVIIPLFMRKLYADHSLQEQHLAQSGLNWTVVRPGVLNDGPKTGSYRIDFTSDNRPSSPKVSRADVADFMVKQLNTNAHIQQQLCLAY